VTDERVGGRELTLGFEQASVPEPQHRQPSPEQKANAAKVIADNLDRQGAVVRDGASAMETAAAARDLAGWVTAKQDADAGLKQLEHLAERASAAVVDVTDAEARERLAGAPQLIQDAQALIAKAPAAPERRTPGLTCAADLLAVLPPDPPPATWRDGDFNAAQHAVAHIFIGRMTYSDVTAFRAIVAGHEDDEITRRFRRFGKTRQAKLIEVLGSDQVKWHARALEAAQQKARRDAPRGAPARPTAAPVDRGEPLTATAGGGAADATTAKLPPAPVATAAAEPRDPATAARRPGVTQEPADVEGARAATPAVAGASPDTLASPAAPGPMQADTTAPSPSASHQTMTSAPEPHGMVASANATAAPPIQRHKAGDGEPTKQRIPYKIQITKPMTGEEFKIAAHVQVFGAVIASDWRNLKAAYTAADSPVEILVDVELFHRGRGVANAARGIDTEATGAVAGADARAKDFQQAPGSDEKAAMLAEIDRRYYAASGASSDTKIKPGELGRAALWRTIRDEVLFQGAHLGNLPDTAKTLIRVGIADRDLTLSDYDQLFRIAKKIESLPPGQAADCASKVTGSTTDLGQFEAAIDVYRSGMAAREQAGSERTAVQNKLLGLEEVYQLYRQYRATPAEAAPSGMAEKLEQQLRRYQFASIVEFASYISRFEQTFEDSAAAITLDILAKYAGKLYKESQRYHDPEVVKALHGKLGGFRAQHQEFDKNAKTYSAERWKAQHEHGAETRRVPGNGGVPAEPPTREQVEAQQKAETAKANAEAQIRDLSKDYPIFAEDELPTDKRLDKVALAQASETELAGVLQAHIAHRQTAVAEAQGHLEGKHELIYKMPKLMPTFYAQMGIQQGSIHDQIIQDKMHGDAVAKVAIGVLVAIVTVALTVVSLGTATPAVLAAGASIGAAGISTYLAFDEYKQYTEDHALAEAGFANDPSVTWLVLAIVGAGADMASAVAVISKLAAAAKTLETSGKLGDFTKAVEALQRSKDIDEKIAVAAERAAAARASYAAAKEQFKADLAMAASSARGALGPFTEPTVFRGLVKMAVAKLREGMHSLEAFIEQLKKARIEAALGEMSPEELTKAKEAWAQAEALKNQVKDPAALDGLLELRLDPTALEKFVGLDVTALRKFAALEPEVLQKLARLRYADTLAKFGACDVEGLTKLATLERPVLEKLGGWDARTVENISRLPTADIEKIAHLKVAPGQAVEGALGGFRSEQFRMGSEVFQLDKSGMMHILERHHPQYWDGSVKLRQSFLDPRMSLDEIQDAIRAIMQQNREQLIKLGTNVQFQVTGSYGGSTYVLGITKGRVAQFYPR